MTAVISNPPYNMKWQHPFFAVSQNRFCLGLPPESNANFAFMLSALEASDRAVFLLPNSVLSTENRDEKIIKKNLVEANYIEAIVQLPDGMFESTSIPTTLVMLNKNKDTSSIFMIDLTAKADKEIREQRGQFGGASKQNRVYKKAVNVFSDETIEEIVDMVDSKSEIKGLSKLATIEDVKSNGYNLSVRRYIESETENKKYRDLSDIVADINAIIGRKNAIKFTINENMARSLGIHDLALMFKNGEKINKEMNSSLSNFDLKIKKENVVTLSRNKELKLEVKNFEEMPEFIPIFFNMWKQYIMMMNNQENKLLIELRDTLLPKLMSGEIITAIYEEEDNKNE